MCTVYAFDCTVGVQHLSSQILLRSLNKYVNAIIYCYPWQSSIRLFMYECAYVYILVLYHFEFRLLHAVCIVCPLSKLSGHFFDTKLNCVGIKLSEPKNKWFSGIFGYQFFDVNGKYCISTKCSQLIICDLFSIRLIRTVSFRSDFQFSWTMYHFFIFTRILTSTWE